MSAYSFSSLKDLLKDQSPTPKLKFDDSPSYTKDTTDSEPNSPSGHPYVTEMFGELHFRESPNGISMSELFPPIQTPPSFQPNNSCQTKTEKSGKVDAREKCLGKLPMSEDACVYPNIWEGEEKLFPPPISCLKCLKIGKPYVYYRFDNNLSRFVQEEINVLPQVVMCTVRGNGHIIMKFANDLLRDEKEKEEGSNEDKMVISDEE